MSQKYKITGTVVRNDRTTLSLVSGPRTVMLTTGKMNSIWFMNLDKEVGKEVTVYLKLHKHVQDYMNTEGAKQLLKIDLKHIHQISMQPF